MMPQPSYNPWGTPMFPNTGSVFGVGSPAEASERQPTFVDSLLSHIAGALGRGFMAPGQALQSTTPITTEQMIKPAADIAGSMTLGAGAIPADLNALRMGIKAYHGSPHDFDRFDLSKIGTGEGVQAYGHGLYFAESPATAQAYRDALELKTGGPGRPAYETPEYSARSILDAVGGDRQRAIAEIEKRRESLSGVDPKYRAAGAEEKFQSVLDILKEGKPLRGGKMYEVNLNADPAHFLDWDKKVRDMPAEMQQRLFDKGLAESHGGDIGSQIYHRRVDQFGPAAATQQLNEAGIPGVKYLDAGSRANVDTNAIRGSLSMWEKALSKTPNDPYAVQQVADLQKQLAAAERGATSNYVMFDDKLIDILRKYGIAGMTAPPIFANAMSEQKQ